MRGPVCGVPSHLILHYLPGDHLEYFEDKVKHLRSFHRSCRQGVYHRILKESGLGHEGGRYSLEFYTEPKMVCLPY